MSIDELNNQDLQKRDFGAPANANNGALNRNYPRYRNQGIATISEQPVVKSPLSSSQELKSLHRVHVNRILMRKRRQARVSKDMVPRIVTVSVIIVALLTLLVS